MTKTPSSEEITDSEKVGYLKERVYVAFTGLAIVVALYTGTSIIERRASRSRR